MLRVDAEEGAIRIELPHGESITVEGLTTGVVEGDQRALFLGRQEAETIGKLIDYVLERVKITPESTEALRAVRPRLERLFED